MYTPAFFCRNLYKPYPLWYRMINLIEFLRLRKKLSSGIKGEEYTKTFKEYLKMKIVVDKFFKEHPELSKLKFNN